MAMAQRVTAYPVEVVQTLAASAAGLRGAGDVLSAARPHHRIMVVEPARCWYGSILDRLTVLCALQKGWDGYHAEPVAFDTANFALNMLESICGSDAPPPAIVPGTSGDLQVEWHTDGADIELHVRAPNDVHAWRSSSTADKDEELELTNDFTLVAGWIKDLAESSGAAKATAV